MPARYLISDLKYKQNRIFLCVGYGEPVGSQVNGPVGYLGAHGWHFGCLVVCWYGLGWDGGLLGL